MVKPFLFILICFAALVFAHAQDQEGFISIDCGIPDNSNYTDGKTGINYVSDVGFLNTEDGLSNTISSQYQTNDLDQQLIHVRSFPRGIKNCYTLKPQRLQGRHHYFIRARFLYGNYDSKNQFPKFDLYFGVDYWGTVELFDHTTPINKEILHVPSNSSDYTYVCLVNTRQGTPFISALEVRLVDDDIYPTDKSESLQLFGRYDLKSFNNKQIIRYKDDIFDRLWSPISFTFHHNVIELNTTTNMTSFLQNDYKLPHSVMQTAITSLNASDPIKSYWLTGNLTAGYYLYMHFADFQSNLRRQFNIHINEEAWYSKFSPDYLSTTTVYTTTPETPAYWFNFSLTKTKNSELPPILNALEIYTARQFSYQFTNQQDLNAIKQIKATYGLKRDWQGDPCLPANYTWEGIGCFNTVSVDNPRIISLNLSSNGLTGKISLYISDLKMLRSLDLSNNNLVGAVHDFLGELQSLEVLILSGNNLSGLIPARLVEKRNSGLLNLSVGGNPNLCESEPCAISPKSTTPATNTKKVEMLLYIIAALVGVIVILVVIGAVWIIILVKKRKSPERQVPRKLTEVVSTSSNRQVMSNSGDGSFKVTQQEFTYSDVLRVTTNFQRVIGKGGYGTVYHGYLDDTQVAVKFLSSTATQRYKNFGAEAKLLTRVHHENLTHLVGYCDEDGKLGLIYEYMANRDLRSHLSEKNINVLSWSTRLNIAVDAAQGLEYLHTGCSPPIIHRDIKSTNVLLNDKFQAKLSDFGLTKIVTTEDATDHVSRTSVGTPRYLDLGLNMNEKSDVFSYGIVLLEIITGGAAIINLPETVHLSEWVDHMLKTEGDTKNVVDPRLNSEFDENSMWKAVDLAMACVSDASNRRPSMNHVVMELKICLSMEMARLNRGDKLSCDSAEQALVDKKPR